MLLFPGFAAVAAVWEAHTQSLVGPTGCLKRRYLLPVEVHCHRYVDRKVFSLIKKKLLTKLDGS